MKIKEAGEGNWKNAFEYSNDYSKDFIIEDFARIKYFCNPCVLEHYEITVEILNDDNKIETFKVTGDLC